MWNPITCDFECDKMCEISKYLDIKNCACKKIVIDNLVLTCECEILRTTKTALINSLDKKVI